MTGKARIWVTRTQPQAAATAGRLRALGLEPVVAPVLQVRAIAGAALDLAGVEALAFTSQAAVTAFVAASPERRLPVFPVGAATAASARDAGFEFVLRPPAGGDVDALADLIAAADPRPAKVLNPTARQPAADLAALLAARGVAARSVPVYEAVRTDLAAAPSAISGVLIHSAKAGEAVAALTPPDQAATLTVYAISAAAAGDLRQRGFGRILTAETPLDTSLLALIAIDQDPDRTHEEL